MSGDILIAGGSDPGGALRDLAIAGGIVADPAAGAPRLDAAGWVVAPGYLDLQVNGADGIDLTGEPEGVWRVAAALPRYGVTAFLPTLVSPGSAVVARACAALAAGPPAGWRGARPLGWHLEGPFLAPGRAGAHPAAALRAPEPGAVDDWSPERGVAMVTLAPELPGAEALIAALAGRGVVVAAGHTDLTAAQAAGAVAAGVRAVTHLFNAMAPMHHREPGLAGAVLDGLDVHASLIADGAHLSDQALRLAWRAMAPERRVLVSDAVAALGAPPGAFRLAGVAVVSDGAAVRGPGGGLAGSATGLDACVRNVVAATGCDPAAAIAAAIASPAALIGRPDLAALRPGDPGDAVVLDADLEVMATVVAGEVVYRAGG